MSVQGFVMSLMHGARGKDAAKALILPYIFGEAVGNQSYPVAESSGSAPLEIENAAAKDMLSFKTNIVPVQDLHGYSNPWPGGGGVNKLPVTADNVVIGKYISNSGAVTSNVNNFYVNQYIPVTPSTEYGLTITTPISYCSVMEYDEDKTFISRTLFTCTGSTQYETETQILTLGATTKYVLIGANLDNSSVTIEKVLSYKYQFQTGMFNGFTPYENKCLIQGWQTITGWIDGKYGGNIEWNQLVKNGNYADTSEWVEYQATYTVSDNVATVTHGSGTLSFLYQPIQCVAGHKYLVSTEVRSDDIESCYVYWDAGSLGAKPVTSNWSKYAILFVGVNNGVNLSIRSSDSEVGDKWQLRNTQIFDLTLMFGAGNEPSTVDEFRSLFPADYYPYNAGTTTCVGAVNGDEYRKIPVTFGALTANQWDEEWENGTFNTTTGVDIAAINQIRAKNKFPILPETEYKYVAPSTQYWVWMMFFDKNKNVIETPTVIGSRGTSGNSVTINGNDTFTSPTGAYYMRFYVSSAYGSTYNHDVAFNSPSSVTTYNPYNDTIYGGTYDFVTGDGIIDSLCKHITSSTNFYRNNALTAGRYYFEITQTENVCKYTASQIALAVQYEKSSYGIINNPYTEDRNCAWVYRQNDSLGYIRFGFMSAMGLDTVDKAKDWLDEVGGIDIYYPLNVPIEFHCDPTDIKLLKGTNYLWADCGNTVSASYPTTVHAEDITLTGVSPLLLANSQAKKMSQCEVNIVATQDGSGDPYPAGGGVNKFPTPDLTLGVYNQQLSQEDYPEIYEAMAKLKAGQAYRSSSTSTGNNALGSVNIFYTDDTYAYIAQTYMIGAVADLSDGTISIKQINIISGPMDYVGDRNVKNICVAEGSTASPTYSPYANVRPIHGVSTLSTTIADNSAGTDGTTYSTELGCMGKNLFDATAHTFTTGDYVNYTTGSMGHNGSNTAACGDYLQVPAGTFTISCTENVGGRIAFYKQDKTFISGSSTIAGVEVPTDAVYFRFSLQSDTPTNVQIELGSSASAYQPYVNECFGGTLNEVTGGLGQTDAVVDMGSLSWSVASGYSEHIFQANVDGKANGNVNLLCEQYKNTSESVANMPNNSIKGNANSNRIYVNDERYSNAASFATAVKGIKLKYELATPINRQYDPHAPESLEGHTYVITNGGGNITATYKGVDLS